MSWLHYKGYGKPGHCLRCARKLKPSNRVWLELDQRTNTYTNTQDVPEAVSQGGFEFGKDCAEKELNITAIERRKKHVPFKRERVLTERDWEEKVNRWPDGKLESMK